MRHEVFFPAHASELVVAQERDLPPGGLAGGSLAHALALARSLARSAGSSPSHESDPFTTHKGRARVFRQSPGSAVASVRGDHDSD